MAHYLLGVEQTGSTLKIGAFKKQGINYFLTALGSVPIEKDTVSTATGLRDWITANLLEAEQIKAVLSLPESMIFLKTLDLPQGSAKQLEEAIRWEISLISPVPFNESTYEWKKISETKTTVKVLVLLIKSEIAFSALEAFGKAGVELTAIEPSSFSLSRILNVDFQKPTLLLTVETAETNLLILESGLPLFTASVTTQLLSSKDGKQDLKTAFEKLLAERANRTIEFWKEKENRPIEQIIITGGASESYDSLASAIQKAVSLPVTVAQKKKIRHLNVGKKENQFPILFLASLGAATRIFSPERLNLFTAEKKFEIQQKEKETKLSTRGSFFATASFALFLTTALIFFVFNLWSVKIGKDIEKGKVAVYLHPAQIFLRDVERTNRLVAQIDTLINQKTNLGDRLRLFTNLTPPSLVFSSINFSGAQGEVWTIRGIGDRDKVLLFYDNLSDRWGAKEVSMPYANLAKETDTEFEITVTW